MTISPAERVEQIRSITYVLRVLGTRHVQALRAMKAARTSAEFNTAVQQARAVDAQIETYRIQLFDLTEA